MGTPRAAFSLLLLLAPALAGCGMLPRDRMDTVERLRGGGELRVGAAEHPPWVSREHGRLTGLEVDLVEGWAAQLGATVRWTHAPEPELIDALQHQDLDIVVAGLDTATPYRSKVALTQPYATSTDRYGNTRHRVLAARPGDSALLFALDRYLAARKHGAAPGGPP